MLLPCAVPIYVCTDLAAAASVNQTKHCLAPIAEACMMNACTYPVILTTYSIGPDKWNGGVLSHNGAVYGMPYLGSKVIKIDPRDDSTTLIGSSLTGCDAHGPALVTQLPSRHHIEEVYASHGVLISTSSSRDGIGRTIFIFPDHLLS